MSELCCQTCCIVDANCVHKLQTINVLVLRSLMTFRLHTRTQRQLNTVGIERDLTMDGDISVFFWRE